ncbi:carboxylate-amine ligase [Actinokineospora baliensis]|uniref:YbdK family carboxylate-amine ligase n=1 Tax=Actinokineospora baliensis TaxID=547056 RepID=UPI0027DB4EE1|nr:YbdK family carboxylate-amine ligase [Actinokineospora baliensis]MBM7776155.1 carboxylate-amine ligase [Actinokineospora baliensis]
MVDHVEIRVAAPKAPATPLEAPVVISLPAPGRGATDRASGLTVGVEEEFLLVDPDAGYPVPAAAAVLADLRVGPWIGQAEFFPTQVETATGVCTELDCLGDEIAGARRAVREAAVAHGVLPMASGVPVVDGPPPPRSDKARFTAIHERFTAVLEDYQACGCHVHVGVADPDTAAAVVNHLAPWLPTLLALSVNSPVRGGRDRRHESLRLLDQARFPGAGLPPYFTSGADHDEQIARLVDCGVIVDNRMTFWLARRSAHLPTVEVRVADTVQHPWEAVLQAALTRALVRVALDELAHGREGPRLDPQLGAASLWCAARHGLGTAIDPVAGVATTARAQIDALLRLTAPALRETGDWAFTRAAIDRLLASGTGADRQRAALRRGRLIDEVTGVGVTGSG